MYGLNLRIHNASLYQSNFSLEVSSTHPKGFVDISESSFGVLNISSGFTVTINNCIADASERDGVFTRIYVVGSVLNISNFTFKNLADEQRIIATILALYSNVTIRDVQFYDNVVVGGNIKVRHQSELYLENGWFQGNGHVGHDRGSGINVDFSSMATIKNVTCIENYVGCFDFRKNSTLVVENSFLANNTFYGMYLEDLKLTSINNTFLMDPFEPWSLIHSEFQLDLILIGCYLFSPSVPEVIMFDLWYSSVVLLSNTYISYGTEIVFNLPKYHNSLFTAKDSSFVGSVSRNSTLLKDGGQLQAQFTNCTILSTPAILIFDTLKPSGATLNNCTIMNSNATTNALAMFHFTEGSVHMTNTTISNIQLKKGVFLYVESKSTVSVTNCLFANNFFKQLFHMGGHSTLNITGSGFINNIKAYTRNSVGLIYSNNSKISFKSSTFQNNSAVLESVKSNIILERCRIENSVAYYILNITMSNITIQYCQFENNGRYGTIYIGTHSVCTYSSIGDYYCYYPNYNNFVQMLQCEVVGTSVNKVEVLTDRL